MMKRMAMIDMKKERDLIAYRKKLDPDGLYDSEVIHTEELLNEIERLREVLNYELNKRRVT